jgi:ubiquinone/menaquinone biosynthesis C-methylase UbiE
MKKMRLTQDSITKTCPEREILSQVLSFNNKDILELGCGKAKLTRIIATGGSNRRITATEVDKLQHLKNLHIDDLPNVDFIFMGAEDMPFADNSFDIILMFKSLHHVPVTSMSHAMSEIARVLKPGGLAYISEPIFAGDFNEILRLFHDEETVRKAAFGAIVDSIEKGELKSVEQIFFNTPRVYPEFVDFEKLIINVSHSNHRLDDDLMVLVKQKFMSHMTTDGAQFNTPIRVDLLSKSNI